MPAFALVDVFESAAAFSRLDAALKDAGRAAFVELVVDDGVGLGATQDLSCEELVFWERVVGEVVEDRLRPGGYLVDGEDAG